MDSILKDLANKKSTYKIKEILNKKTEKAKSSFWEYCKITNPDFYYEERSFLKDYCNLLEDLYRRKLRLPDGRICRKIIINMPPRHGKSRTLVLFCQWCFGQNDNEKVITCSYGDDTASDFSRFTRDAIAVESTLEESIEELAAEYNDDIPEEEINNLKIVFSDIFPNVKIKKGNASFEKWALEGKFFSYKGAGVGGAITGRGGSITIVDDPIKDEYAANNEFTLKKIWKWYTDTFRSRAESGAIQIINMTRWSSKDLCGMILSNEKESKDWMVVCREARVNGKMLCESILSEEEYFSQKNLMSDNIFEANYHQKPIDLQGSLYKNFKKYKYAAPEFEKLYNYTDTADTGTDYLCSISFGVYAHQAYVLDVYYTQDPMEKTEPETARRMNLHGIRGAAIESNNGGRGFARNVQRILKEKFKNFKCKIRWFHQSKNKRSRILTNASNVMEDVIMPEDWKERWPEFYEDITHYQAEGKNEHDDCADGITGVVEILLGEVIADGGISILK